MIQSCSLLLAPLFVLLMILRRHMGIGLLTFLLSIPLLLRCSALPPPPPNTDAFYVFEFFLQMKVEPTSANGNSSDVCSWKGVTCDGKGEKVVALEAIGFGFSGPINETTIAKLSMLRVLDLSNNSITAIPRDFAELGHLARLNLSCNNIAGALPSYLSNFHLMESIDLSRNEFSGQIPEQLGSLPNLRVLNLSWNLLEMSIPDSVLRCVTLVSLDLSNNKLNGGVPAGFGAALRELTTLDLSGNQFNGSLQDLVGLDSITYLNLSGNHFHGNFSQIYHSSASSWSSLVYLDMSMNELEGEFFPLLSGLLSLKHLNLAFNGFSSQQLDLIELSPALEFLILAETNLNGQIPRGIEQLHNLKLFDLSQNHINGSIPELSTENLQVIDLSVNNLTGEIPKSLQHKLSTMERFNFSYNNLTYCVQDFPLQVFNSSFIAARSDCPIAVNPNGIGSKGRKHEHLKLGLAVAFSLIFLILGIVGLALRFRKKNSSFKEKNVPDPLCFERDPTTWVADVKFASSIAVVVFEKPLVKFTFADLLNVTSNFDRVTLLAEGKFGPVYRGILPGGIHVAVKVLIHGTRVSEQDATKELERLGQIKHPNLVPLTGYCLAGEQSIVMYEYMENGNLQNLLHDLPLGVQSTEEWTTDTWRLRHKVALGTARALAFLHHGCFPQIVQRDVKASSIYLDSAMEPRLADFGLSSIAKTSMDDEVSQGPPGYAPPEFLESEEAVVTAESDVFAFGVVLFELLTGKKAVGDSYPEDKESTLVTWARALVKRNELSKLIDLKIKETGPEKQMEEALRIAYLCTADLPSKRPTMQQAVGLLKDIEPVNIEH